MVQPKQLNFVGKLQNCLYGKKCGSIVVLMEHRDFNIVLSDLARKQLLEEMLVSEDINKMKLKIVELENIILDKEKQIVELSYNYDNFKDNDKKTRFYIGCFNTAKALFEFLEKDLPVIHHNKINQFQMFFINADEAKK